MRNCLLRSWVNNSLGAHGRRTRRLFALLLSPVVGACAGNDPAQPGLTMSGALSVERARSADYDYLISIKSQKGLGINIDDQAARDRLALQTLKDQCEAPEIVKETVSRGDEYLFGNSPRTYKIEVKC